jgi:hypothetical protein
MIHLTSGSNDVYVTVAEKATLTNPTYIFVFQSDLTGEKFMCSTSYTTVQDNIQKFTITVQASPAWQSGQVELGKKGFYHYYVYERSNLTGLVYNTIIAADISTYVPTYFTTLVESGKMEFDATAQTVNTYRNTTPPVKAYGD